MGAPGREVDVAALVAALRCHEATVACAESLTAGLVCARLADVPGASAVLRGGVVAYATDAKAAVLGVDAALLARRGPVDEDVALAMAAGAARLLGADVGVATTGVAGPGPSDGLEAGTVVVAVCGPGGASRPGGGCPGGGRPARSPAPTVPDAPGTPAVRRLHLPGGRAEVRAASVRAALDLLARWAGPA